jgi:hypothetical protein
MKKYDFLGVMCSGLPVNDILVIFLRYSEHDQIALSRVMVPFQGSRKTQYLFQKNLITFKIENCYKILILHQLQVLKFSTHTSIINVVSKSK